ncbi:hypothetical protein PoB_000329200 [Plakobranchus ocellatus]|uniref:Uncharacterized protein n=1 Tax=Plakobranchus ocellatus TaxID=259542 RepID=A0AAV3Y249_9GAST|nr:hypothetical protein PoB_000329200 [Plakobranchus ocellatus]
MWKLVALLASLLLVTEGSQGQTLKTTPTTASEHNYRLQQAKTPGMDTEHSNREQIPSTVTKQRRQSQSPSIAADSKG